MQLLQKLLSRNRPQIGRNVRGLSTAELVGIIVIVGILGALGGTYIAGLVGQAQTNAIAQNVASLNTVAASSIAGGGTFGATAGLINATVGAPSPTTDAALITSLNNGVVVGNVTYKMSPPISSAAITADTYQATVSGTPPNATIVFAASSTSTTP
jgi:hypothetical protein